MANLSSWRRSHWRPSARRQCRHRRTHRPRSTSRSHWARSSVGLSRPGSRIDSSGTTWANGGSPRPRDCPRYGWTRHALCVRHGSNGSHGSADRQNWSGRSVSRQRARSRQPWSYIGGSSRSRTCRRNWSGPNCVARNSTARTGSDLRRLLGEWRQRLLRLDQGSRFARNRRRDRPVGYHSLF